MKTSKGIHVKDATVTELRSFAKKYDIDIDVPTSVLRKNVADKIFDLNLEEFLNRKKKK